MKKQTKIKLASAAAVAALLMSSSAFAQSRYSMGEQNDPQAEQPAPYASAQPLSDSSGQDMPRRHMRHPRGGAAGSSMEFELVGGSDNAEVDPARAGYRQGAVIAHSIETRPASMVDDDPAQWQWHQASPVHAALHGQTSDDQAAPRDMPGRPGFDAAGDDRR